MRMLNQALTMPEKNADEPELRLSLPGRLEDLTRLWPWIQALAAAYAIPRDMLFAVNLCLEEALSNIVRHGYGGDSALSISIDFAFNEASGFAFVIEDCAPAFNPLEYTLPKLPLPSDFNEDFAPGGQGIRLMRKFAGSLSYQRLSGGNRLTIGFNTVQPQKS